MEASLHTTAPYYCGSGEAVNHRTLSKTQACSIGHTPLVTEKDLCKSCGQAQPITALPWDFVLGTGVEIAYSIRSWNSGL